MEEMSKSGGYGWGGCTLWLWRRDKLPGGSRFQCRVRVLSLPLSFLARFIQVQHAVTPPLALTYSPGLAETCCLCCLCCCCCCLCRSV